MHLLPRCRYAFNSTNNFIMSGCKHLVFLKSYPLFHALPPKAANFYSQTYPFSTEKLVFSTILGKPSCPISCRKSHFSYTPHSPIPRPVTLEDKEQQVLDSPELTTLRTKLKKIGIDGDSCKPGQYSRLLCPMCEGGASMAKSLSLLIKQEGDTALWNCFRAKCGWKGSTRVS